MGESARRSAGTGDHGTDDEDEDDDDEEGVLEAAFAERRLELDVPDLAPAPAEGGGDASCAVAADSSRA